MSLKPIQSLYLAVVATLGGCIDTTKPNQEAEQTPDIPPIFLTPYCGQGVDTLYQGRPPVSLDLPLGNIFMSREPSTTDSLDFIITHEWKRGGQSEDRSYSLQPGKSADAVFCYALPDSEPTQMRLTYRAVDKERVSVEMCEIARNQTPPPCDYKTDIPQPVN